MKDHVGSHGGRPRRPAIVIGDRQGRYRFALGALLVLFGLAALLVGGCPKGSGKSRGDPTYPPNAPSGVLATGGDRQVTVSWIPEAGATSYNLYFASTPGVTKANFGTLPDGTKITGAISPEAQTGLMNGTAYYFVVTALEAAVESAESMEVQATPTAPSASCPPAISPTLPQGTLHPIPGTLRDLVYDPDRDRVYITNFTGGSLEIFDVATDTLLTPLAVGPEPWGLDLTPDNSKLLVCLSGTDQIAVVDLTVDPPVISTTLTVIPDTLGTNQPREIACASNGLAFFTCTAPSGDTVPRQIDLTTMNITFRTDIDGGRTYVPTELGVSGDRSHIVFAERSWSAEYFIYSATQDSFTSNGRSGGPYNSGASADATGSRFALLPGPYVVGDSLHFFGWVALGSTVISFVFAPSASLGYGGIDGQPEIVIVDTSRFLVIDRIITPANLIGKLKIDPTGAVVYAIAQGGLLAVPVDVNRPPILEPLGKAVVNLGATIGLALQAVDPNGDAIVYCAENLPPGATFDPATRLFHYTPAPGQVGMAYTVTFYATDGLNGTSQDLDVEVTNPASFPVRKIPIEGVLHDGVYDPVRDQFYLTNTPMNRVEVIRLADNTRLDPIPVGSQPRGIDLDGPSTRMVVCPSQAEFIQVVDLMGTPPTILQSYPVPDDIAGDNRTPGSVAVVATDHALFAAWSWGTGSVFVRDLDMASGTITVRMDAPGGSQLAPVPLLASGDDSRIIFNSGSDVFLYHSGTDTFTPKVSVWNSVSLDGNGDGTRFLLSGWAGIRVFDENLAELGEIVGIFGHSALRQGSAAEGYHHDGWPRVDLLNLATYTITGSFDLPDLTEGWMRTNDIGTQLLVVTQTGVCIVDLP